jgi:predicted nuclease of predicted toxin-antitoxin system
MKFLVDAQLPPALAGWLNGLGHEAVHVFDIGLGAASDAHIAERAETDNAVLVSKDEDFLTLRLPDRFALLWLRCGNTTKRALLDWLSVRWGRIQMMLEVGERLIEVR